MQDSVCLWGSQFVAVPHARGVDILSAESPPALVQSLSVPLATRVSFCRRTGALAVLEESVLRIFSPGLGALADGPLWRETKTVLIPPRFLSGGAIQSHSFSHPVYQLHVKGMMTLCHVESSKFELVNDFVNMPALVSGGYLSSLGGFMATLESRGKAGALTLRISDISAVFDRPIGEAVVVTQTAEAGFADPPSREREQLQPPVLAWRPWLDADCELLLCCTGGGSVKIWMVQHGKEHEIVTAALHAAASAGIRTERCGSLHAATPPEIRLVADISPLYAGLSILSSPLHLSSRRIDWVHQLAPPGAGAGLHTSDLWLSVLLSPLEHPMSPVWVCQLIHLRPKGRYNQYDASFVGEPLALKSPLDCPGLSQLAMNSASSAAPSKLLCASVFGRFAESAADLPSHLFLSAQFQPQLPRCSDVLTLGLDLGASSGSSAASSGGGYALLYHTADVAPAASNRFVPLSISEEMPVSSGISRRVCRVAGSSSAVAKTFLYASLASYSATFSGFSAAASDCIKAPLAVYGGNGQNDDAPLLTPMTSGSPGILRAIIVSPSSLDATSSIQRPQQLGSWLIVLERSPSGLKIALYSSTESGGNNSASGGGPPASPLSVRSYSEDGASRGLRSPSVDQAAAAAAAAAAASFGSHGAQYSVEIVPDRQYGLGLRLGARDGAVAVDSFKRSDDNQPLAAELSGVQIGDELVAANGVSLIDLSLNEVIDSVRGILGAAGVGALLTLTLRQPTERDEIEQSTLGGDSASRAPPDASRNNPPVVTARASSCSPHQAMSAIESARLVFDASWGWQLVDAFTLPTCSTSADVCLSGGNVIVAHCDNGGVLASRLSISNTGRAVLNELCRTKHAGAAFFTQDMSSVTLQLWHQEENEAGFIVTMLGSPQMLPTPAPQVVQSNHLAATCTWPLQVLSASCSANSVWVFARPRTCTAGYEVCITGRLGEEKCNMPWALLCCPLQSSFDGGTLIFHPVEPEARTSCMFFAQILGDKWQSGEGMTPQARAVLSQVVLIDHAPFSDCPSMASTTKFDRRLDVPVFDSSPPRSTEDYSQPESLFLTNITGARWEHEDSLRLYGNTGSITLQRVQPRGSLRSDSLWFPTSLHTLCGGVPAHLALAGRETPDAASGKDLVCGLFDSPLVHAQACDPVDFLCAIFGCFSTARSLEDMFSVMEGFIVALVGNYSVEISQISRLEVTIDRLVAASVAATSLGGPTASFNSSTRADLATLAVLGWDDDSVALIAAIATALHKIWRWSLRPSDPPSVLFGPNIDAPISTPLSSKLEGRLSSDFAAGFAAENMDAPAVAACLLSQLHACADGIHSLVKASTSSKAPNSTADSPLSSSSLPSPRMSAVVAALAISSPCQAALYRVFLLQPVEAHFLADEAASATAQSLAGALATVRDAASGNRAAGKAADMSGVAESVTGRSAGSLQAEELLHRGQLWAGRLDGGRGAGSRGLDVLGLLSDSLAPLWVHDLSPVLDLVTQVAIKQFRQHKDSMKVFLELVVTGQRDKLTQLARADRNVTGKQLQSLLGQELAGERGRQVLKKNAFALMRLQRYRHAAAAFLCSEPPMLREACGVLAQQLGDPMLALLVARLVEHRVGTKRLQAAGLGLGAAVHPSGLVLGPAARNVITEHVIPALQLQCLGSIDEQQFKWSAAVGLGLRPGLDRSVALWLASSWLQDRARLCDALATNGLTEGLFDSLGLGASGEGGLGGGKFVGRAGSAVGVSAVSRWRGEILTVATQQDPLASTSVSATATVASQAQANEKSVPVLPPRSPAVRWLWAHSLLSAPAACAWVRSRRRALLPPGSISGLALAMTRLLSCLRGGGAREATVQAAKILLQEQSNVLAEPGENCAFDALCRRTVELWRQYKVRTEMETTASLAHVDAPAVAASSGNEGGATTADEDQDVRRALEALQKNKLVTRAEAAGSEVNTQQTLYQQPAVRRGFNLAYEVPPCKPGTGAAPNNMLDAFMMGMPPPAVKPPPAALHVPSALDAFMPPPSPPPAQKPKPNPPNALDMFMMGQLPSKPK